MSRRMREEATPRIFRGVVIFKNEDGNQNPSYYGPYSSVGQARSEVTRQKKYNSSRKIWRYELIDSFVEQSLVAWERVTEMGADEANKERQPDKDRVAKEQKKDKERAERDRPK